MERGAYDEMRRLEDHHWWFRGKRRMVTPLLREALTRPDASVLEVGCGTGGNLAHLERRFPATHRMGLDFDGGALEYCRERGLAAELVRGDGTRLPLEGESLDCIVALDIIEHFDDDDALLREFHRTLRPGGQVVASVPAYPSLWSPHDEFLHHRRRYRRGELEGKLRNAGFDVRRRNGFNFILLAPIALVRWWKRERQAQGSSAEGTYFFDLPAPLNAFMAGLFALEELVVRLWRVPFGVSLLVRAEKAR